MSNHVHFVVVPERVDSLAVLFRRVHGGYAQAMNVAIGRTGHLWQNRFYSCPLSDRHLWTALRYVETNPVRAGLTATPAAYRWSSAAAHLSDGRDETKLLDTEFWSRSGGSETWKDLHAAGEQEARVHLLRRCTYAGRPFGDEEFVTQLEDRFQRKWRRWSFESSSSAAAI